MATGKGITLLLLTVFLAGCATYYDQVWVRRPGVPWLIPEVLRVVIADRNTVAKRCQEAGVPYSVEGCYDWKNATLYSVDSWDIVLHEFRHIWEGYYHAY